MLRSRSALLASVCLVPALLIQPAFAQQLPGQPAAGDSRTPAQAGGLPRAGGRIASIQVEGNQRIESGTILSYMLVQPGDPFDSDRLDRSLKTLYATGLFSDVRLRREGDTLIVELKENPLVNRVAFEGNHKLTEDQLKAEVQTKPRSVFTPALVQADRQRILDAYAKRGRFNARVEPKVIQLEQNRVDVVFEISDGDNTLISRIAFVGNHAFSVSRLQEVVDSRETAWWRFLSSSDSYDPDRVNYDKELLRRFYLHNGYVDFQVTNATAELAPDKSAFFVTFELDEGAQYKVSKITVNSSLRNITGDELRPKVDLDVGDVYDGDAVERSVQAITDSVQASGQAFVQVNPKIQRNPKDHTVELVFDVTEGPRVYIERIDITGNTRTKDKVIRREFRVAEGDAFNAALVRRSRQRLQDLGYFTSVNIQNQPGSAPDKTVLATGIEEKATGELTVGGGYSTDAGALLSAGLREKNFIGTGIDAGINGILAQKQNSIDLSVTDPYFLDRNIVAGFDLFHVQNNNQDIAQYSERRTGFAVRLGYEFNEHLRQSVNYTLVDRSVYNVATTASIYIQQEAGESVLSQVGQTLTLDYRDSTVEPHAGFVVRAGTDFAGLGGNAHYVRAKGDGTYFVPLDRYTGNSDWGIAISAGTGYLFSLGHQENIIDRFFLGGDNLRGFQSGGAGPHALPYAPNYSEDSVGGKFIWTQSTELHYPLPISADIGLSGRAFVDIGGLSQVNTIVLKGTSYPVTDSHAPRIGTGLGVSWKTPFGLINIDLAVAVLKQKEDKTQFFRFGFGTRF